MRVSVHLRLQTLKLYCSSSVFVSASISALWLTSLHSILSHPRSTKSYNVYLRNSSYLAVQTRHKVYSFRVLVEVNISSNHIRAVVKYRGDNRLKNTH